MHLSGDIDKKKKLKPRERLNNSSEKHSTGVKFYFDFWVPYQIKDLNMSGQIPLQKT